jgi:hypothetical protein
VSQIIDIYKNISDILSEMPAGVELEAACKTRTPEEVQEAVFLVRTMCRKPRKLTEKFMVMLNGILSDIFSEIKLTGP